MVRNNEAACLQVQTDQPYIDTDDEQKNVPKGIILDILPTVQNDGKEILLKAHALVSDIRETQPQAHNSNSYEIPYLQITQVPIHTMVRDRQTILVIGPAFPVEQTVGRSTIQDKQHLLILIKLTVVETDEAPPPAGGMGGGGFGGGFVPDRLLPTPKED